MTLKKELVNLLVEKFNVNEMDAFANSKSSLFLKPFNFNYEDLIFLIALLMQKYNITFNEKDFFDYKFSNIDSIVLLISKKLERRKLSNGNTH